ncbi:MAG TPA: hypothetical protein VGM28_11100, partial [Candidatus Limnocylindrales bacterium]
MHLQIKGSPHDTAGNIRHVVNALAKEGINIISIGPDFEAPHVRILVEHDEDYDPNNGDDTFNKALAALEADGLTPEVRPGVVVPMPDEPGALKIVLERLTREGYTVESILVLPGEDDPGVARVGFGI